MVLFAWMAESLMRWKVDENLEGHDQLTSLGVIIHKNFCNPPTPALDGQDSSLKERTTLGPETIVWGWCGGTQTDFVSKPHRGSLKVSMRKQNQTKA